MINQILKDDLAITMRQNPLKINLSFLQQCLFLFLVGMDYLKPFTKKDEATASLKIKTVTLSSDTPLHAPSNKIIASENQMDSSKEAAKQNDQKTIAKVNK